MKKITFFMFFVSSFTLMNAQVFDMTSSWTEITTNLFDKDYCYIRNYKLEGEVVINGLKYTKVYVNGYFYAAIRESEEKLFAYFYFSEAEIQIYDFSWEIGKEICFYNTEVGFTKLNLPEPHCVEITEIDSVLLLDGNYYLTLFSGSLIRGIGFKMGFFNHVFCLPNNGDQYAMLCFSRNGELVYKNEKYANCYSCETQQTSIEIPTHENLLNVYTNPFNDVLTISSLSNTVSQIEIFDMLGKKVYNQMHGNAINLSSFSKGIYLLKLYYSNGKVSKFKIIKQ